MNIYKYKDGFDANNQRYRIEFRCQWLASVQGRLQTSFTLIELSYSADSHGGNWIQIGLLGFCILIGKY